MRYMMLAEILLQRPQNSCIYMVQTSQRAKSKHFDKVLWLEPVQRLLLTGFKYYDIANLA